jgi:hypothetical protein
MFHGGEMARKMHIHLPDVALRAKDIDQKSGHVMMWM